MKTPKQIIKDIGGDCCQAFYDHPNCGCKRCKDGVETFLIEEDISKIQLDVLEWCLNTDKAVIRIAIENIKNHEIKKQ